MMPKNDIIFIMGVSGSGKTTIGELLSKELKIPFFDGDDFHSKKNVQKMASGEPLTDSDRREWLVALNKLAKSNKKNGAIIACSALKTQYRAILKDSINNESRFIYLKGNFATIMNRMQERKGHFMPSELLRSQFETLEPPQNAILVSIEDSPEGILQTILEKIGPRT